MAIQLTILKAIFLLLAFFTLGLIFGQAMAQQMYDQTTFLSRCNCRDTKIETTNVACCPANKQPKIPVELIVRHVPAN